VAEVRAYNRRARPVQARRLEDDQGEGKRVSCAQYNNSNASDLVVSRGFGGIFAELLSGTFAKLQPPDILDLMDVLEIEVQLGTVWKTGLTKLSGGQRCAHLIILLTTLSYLSRTYVY